jgi:hypothetical protein
VPVRNLHAAWMALEDALSRRERTA